MCPEVTSCHVLGCDILPPICICPVIGEFLAKMTIPRFSDILSCFLFGYVSFFSYLSLGGVCLCLLNNNRCYNCILCYICKQVTYCHSSISRGV